MTDPEKLRLPWTYHRQEDGPGGWPRDWIEDANGNIVVEAIGHIDGPATVKAVNTHFEMLAALKAWRDAASTICLDDAERKRDTAIAKAEGQS